MGPCLFGGRALLRLQGLDITSPKPAPKEGLLMVTTTPQRLQAHLRRCAEAYPGAWKKLDDFCEGRGKELPLWPDWCWCPLAASYAILSGGGGDNRLAPGEQAADVGILGALATWRMTQGIYRFDTDMFEALWSTPLSKIPREILYRLPEWCVYIEAPKDYRIIGAPISGWFCHLEYDFNTGRAELRLVLDQGERLVPLVIHLTEETLEECVRAALAESVRQLSIAIGEDLPVSAKDAWSDMNRDFAPLVSVLLYLCSETPDMSDLRGRRSAPGNPMPVKIKQGLRTFPASGPTTWLTGYRVGTALRLATDGRQDDRGAAGGGTHASPRPHIRRAHWHTYWTGPRGSSQTPVLRWLPPIPVGAGELVPTIRRVK